MVSAHIGTSGWSYRHWVRPFYPPKTPAAKFLEHYTRHFDCVELNASFYRLPRPSTVAGWLERTPPGFCFCVKLSRLITHLRRLEAVDEPLAAFFERFAPLRPRMGPVLIQLPPSLAYDRRLFERFLQALQPFSAHHRFALEARHESWMASEALEHLSAGGLAWVIAHSNGRFPYKEAVTTDFVYLRFHGPEKLYGSGYPDEQLCEYARKVAAWLTSDRHVWAFFNNDIGGHAVQDAQRLKDFVEEALSTAGA